MPKCGGWLATKGPRLGMQTGDREKLEETERGREILKRAANRSKGGQDQGEAIEEKTEDSDGKVGTRMEDVEDENSNKKIAWGPPEIIEHETEEAE